MGNERLMECLWKWFPMDCPTVDEFRFYCIHMYISLVTLLNSSGGAVALTLAAGVVGQIKIISMITAGNAATMTVANGNLAGMSTSIVWDAVGEGITLMYNGAKWVVVGNYGATIS